MTTEAKVLRELATFLQSQLDNERAKFNQTIQRLINDDVPLSEIEARWNAYNGSTPVDSISQLDSYTTQTIVIALTAILDLFEGNPTSLDDLSERDVKNALCALIKAER